MWAPFSCCKGVYLCERNHISITDSDLRILWSVLEENSLWTSHFLPCSERDLAPRLRHPQLSFFLQSAWSSLSSQKEASIASQICFHPPSSPWFGSCQNFGGVKNHRFRPHIALHFQGLSSILLCKLGLLLLVFTMPSSVAFSLCLVILTSLECATIKAQCVFPPTGKRLHCPWLIHCHVPKFHLQLSSISHWRRMLHLMVPHAEHGQKEQSLVLHCRFQWEYIHFGSPAELRRVWQSRLEDPSTLFVKKVPFPSNASCYRTWDALDQSEWWCSHTPSGKGNYPDSTIQLEPDLGCKEHLWIHVLWGTICQWQTATPTCL